MAITLIVEDGSQALNPNQYFVAGGNTYAALTDLVVFAEARGKTPPAEPDQQAILLLKAMDYLEDLNFIGYRFTRLQPLRWPRYDVMIEGWPLKVNEIPWQLVALQCALALQYLQYGEMMPTWQPHDPGSVSSEEVGGAVRVGYENNARVLKISVAESARRFQNVLVRKSGLALVRA